MCRATSMAFMHPWSCRCQIALNLNIYRIAVSETQILFISELFSDNKLVAKCFRND